MPSKPISSPATPPLVPVTSRFRFSWNMGFEFYRRRDRKSTTGGGRTNCSHRLGRHLGAAQELVLGVHAAGHVGVLREETLAQEDLGGVEPAGRAGTGRARKTER